MHAPTSVYSQDFSLANSALQYSLPYLHELFILESAIDVGNTRHMRNDLLLPVSHHTPLLKNKLNLCNFTYEQRSYFFLRLQKSDILDIFKHKIVDLRFKSTFNLLL